MVARIVWSAKAQQDRKQNLSYWIDRNKSNLYSVKLNQLFQDAINLIAKHPNIGKPTDYKNTRIKRVRAYLIVYTVNDLQISIIAIWDGRQDPTKFDKIV